MTPRVVVIAAGSHIFRAAHIPAIAEAGVHVAGVYDADEQRAAEVAAEHGWEASADLDALLAVPADAAVVCAPHPLHADLVRRCLAAGRAVLVEKPLAPRLSDIDRIIAASADAGVPVAVVHQHRLRDEVAVARRMLRDGELGRIHRALVVASYPKRSVYYTDTPWRGTWHGEGGGVLLNQGLHDIDLLVHMLGLPSRVAASLRTVAHPIETEDTADLLLEWDRGFTASVHITSAAALGENRLEVHGSAKSVRISSRGLEVRVARDDFDAFAAAPGGHFDAFPVEDWRLVVESGRGSHADVYADLVAALADRRAPYTTAADARDAVEVICAATIASDDGGWIALPVDPSRADAILDSRIDGAVAPRPSLTTQKEVVR